VSVRITNNLGQFVQRIDDKAQRGMTQALILGASEAAALTPIDTSTLINSQFRQVVRESRGIVGRVGYTAAYALPVHDPENQQNFRRASAEKEFLKKGFERAEPNIRKALRGALK
jgi:hypothetical protein